MDHLPQSIQQGLSQDSTIEVSEWVKNAINSATKIEVFDHEKTLASKLIQYTEVYNLFDGIISFTESHIRDHWLEQIFHF